jgi:hypothetical protein
MANTLLTIDQITRMSLVILHQQCNFIGNINRSYDASFAKEGAKIGSTLRIRLPNEYTVSTGPTLSVQDQTELSVTLTVDSQKHVDMAFTSVDMTLDVQDFTDRFVKPSMSVLAASLESTALAMTEDIYQTVDNLGTSITMRQITDVRTLLVNALTPMDDTWAAILRPQDNGDLVNANKGLFQAASEIASQYRKGKMGVTGGFTFYENTLLPTHASGTTSATASLIIATSLTVSATTPTTSFSTTSNTLGGGTWVVGDVFTVSGLNRAHPETKSDTGELQQFVVTTAVTATSAQTLAFAPSIYLSGARQNVIPTAVTASTITKVGVPSDVYKSSIFFNPGAFTFATADLIKPNGLDMVGRQVKDGISMRILRDYDPTYDRLVTRCDVLSGNKTLRAQMAARILSM